MYRSLKVDISTAGDNAIIPATAGQKISVYRFFLIAHGAVDVTFKDGSTDLSGPLPLTGKGASLTLAASGDPWFEGSTGNDLNLNLSAAARVCGRIYYRLGV